MSLIFSDKSQIDKCNVYAKLTLESAWQGKGEQKAELQTIIHWRPDLVSANANLEAKCQLRCRICSYWYICVCLKLVEMLLEAGAHLDQPNKAGDCPALLISVNPHNNINLVKYSSLRCLAASAVCRYRIPYSGQIPVTLESFVSFHQE